MRRYTTLIIGIVVVALGILALTTLYTMQQTQQGIVLRLGNPVREITEPGLTDSPTPLQRWLVFDRPLRA